MPKTDLIVATALMLLGCAAGIWAFWMLRGSHVFWVFWMLRGSPVFWPVLGVSCLPTLLMEGGKGLIRRSRG